MNGKTYEESGVNITNADSAKKEMAGYIDGNANKRVLNRVGAFASLYDFSFPDIKEPVLVLKTEEPGSKQKLSISRGKYKNIAYDMVNHLVNDILMMGASPLAVQDAIICGKLEKDVVSQLVKYIAEACVANGCVLTGGETSEQPNVLDNGVYVLTSSVVGVVEKSKIIDGRKIKEGDVVLALASNGIHTNGYSFLRMLMKNDPKLESRLIDGEKFIDIILKPHRSYYHCLRDIFEMDGLHGLAHITGGGLKGNLNRILPNHLSAEIDLHSIETLPIFKYIKKVSGADDEELLRTFNMGVGAVAVVDSKDSVWFMKHFADRGVTGYPIGKIAKGDRTVEFIGKLK